MHWISFQQQTRTATDTDGTEIQFASLLFCVEGSFGFESIQFAARDYTEENMKAFSFVELLNEMLFSTHIFHSSPITPIEIDMTPMG